MYDFFMNFDSVVWGYGQDHPLCMFPLCHYISKIGIVKETSKQASLSQQHLNCNQEFTTLA